MPNSEIATEARRADESDRLLPCAEPATRPLPFAGYGEVSRTLAVGAGEALRAFSAGAGVELDRVFEAAWAICLWRYTREPALEFAVARSAPLPRLAVVRLRVDDEQPIAALLAAEPAHEANPGWPIGHSLLTCGSAHGTAPALRGGAHGTAPGVAPLHVCVDAGERVALRVEFDRSRFRETAAARVLGSLCFVLEQLATAGIERVGQVEVVPPEERDRILVAWNDTARPAPHALLIHELFEARATEQPLAVALVCDGREVRYAELEERANQLAHALRARGAAPGVFVAVCVERGFELVIALLAVAKSGAAYVPLDPREPPPRLASMLADARARLIVTEARHRHLFATELEWVDVRARTLRALPVTRPPRVAASDRPCYAIFTSGSTGKPNGVVLSHRAVVNTLEWVNRTFEVGPGDRLLFVTSPCFDLSVYDVFGVLGAGGTVVIADDAQLADPGELARCLASDAITIWNSAPAALQRVVDSAGGSPATASSLRLCLLSGDWIPLALPAALRQLHAGARVVSLGGATEAAIWSNWFAIGELDPRWRSIPYGKPIQNAQYYVLDERMQPVPVGVAGDLYIGGACVADGYLNRPQLTAARFVRNPFRSGDGDAWLYRTGDLARYCDSGDLEFLGRSDFQVKVRGFRVDTGEVESALLALGGVHQAVCTAGVDASGANSLWAYVVPEVGRECDEAALRAALSAVLPGYMVPARVMPLHELPLSSNGKVDRRALPTPRRSRSAPTLVPARDERERRMVALWEALLDQAPIGITDDFFEAGGHSLLALMLVTRTRDELGIDIPLSRFLERPTIEGVLRSLDESARVERVSPHLYRCHPHGARLPIVMLGSGPYAMLYREFPRLFGPQQPVHVLITRDDGADAAQAAAWCEAQLADAFRDGPVIMGGFGAGAATAVALARRLQARGRSVPLLVLIDPSALAPRASQRMLRRIARAGARLYGALASGRLGSGPEALDSDALVILAGDAGRRARDDAAGAAHALVRGTVSTLELGSGHMGFLADGSRRSLVDAITSYAARASSAPG